LSHDKKLATGDSATQEQHFLQFLSQMLRRHHLLGVSTTSVW